MTTGPPSLAPRRRPRQARSRQTVEFVLEAAAQVFAARGYAGATTNHIAERAGVSVGTLYQYYPNKDAVLLALAERHLEESGARLAEVAAGLRAARPGLEELVRALVAAAVELNTDPVHAVLFDDSPRTPELADRLRSLRRAVTSEVANHLGRMARGGAHPGLVAEYLVLAVDAGVHDVVIRRPAGVERETAVAELVALCVRAVPGAAATAAAGA